MCGEPGQRSQAKRSNGEAFASEKVLKIKSN